MKVCHGDTRQKGMVHNMNKAEVSKLEKLKKEYLIKKSQVDKVFNRPLHEYDQLSESTKRKGDQDYGYALGLYQALDVLGMTDGLPNLD